ncbi:non-ribosomal peptide synthetase [Herbaspirillum sp. 1130]|uniref:amino acid adenylation domain-containing protein n=1 Tax=Herbaspirillum sp. 1130 TaxID=2806562 RepID=UPI001AE43C13|nr:non-ribosomal peptide synthetase [Herbaspirillum sp. 1130]MBP1313408.1 amino acid adenylation domain-containing protein [Herbaspirillum sp. 1130]
MNASQYDIARRFALLPGEKKTAFLAALKSRGIDFGRLPIVKAAAADRSALSYAQARQWFLWQLDRESSAYHLSTAMQLQGELDLPLLQQCFNALVARHASLRTRFGCDAQGGAYQEVLPQGEFEFCLCDYRHSQPPSLAELVGQQAQQLYQRPFDLEHGPLLRVGVIRESEQQQVLVVVMHHIVSDGWSMEILLREFIELYREGREPSPVQWPSLAIDYADYAAWQRNWLEAGERDRQIAYWRAQLGEHHPVLQLPVDHPRREDGHYSAATHRLTLPRALAEALPGRAQTAGATVFMVLLAALQSLLFRYAGDGDIRVGVPVANRRRAEIEDLVGFFVNTQVVRAGMSDAMSLQQVLEGARHAVIEAQAHQDLPFEQLVETLQPDRSSGMAPLFQVLFNHQSAHGNGSLTLPGLQAQEYILPGKRAQFELVIDSVDDGEGGIAIDFIYASELFSAVRMERMARHYLILLEALVWQPGRRIGDIDLLQEQERQALQQWDGSLWRAELGPAAPVPVHQQFSRIAQEQPDAVAVLFGQQRLSYGELEQRANQLAHHLLAHGAGPETRVGIAVERSLEMIVGLLAILKTGAAYVPLDMDYPAERLAYIAADSGFALLITHSRLRQRLVPDRGVQVIELDRLQLQPIPVTPPMVALHPDNLAYVIYTSGSTGQPKGAAIGHGALAHCMGWMQRRYALSAQDAVLHKAPFGFDVSVWEIFWPLTAGTRLVLAAPGEQKDPERITELIRRHGITTLNFVPSMLQAFLSHDGIEQQTRLRYVICGGESMPAATQAEALRRLAGVSLQNLYGPTETTIHVSQWSCRDDGRSLVPIGRPIFATSAQVLDGALNPVPLGVAGELYIGGALLGRGYLGRAALTAERFVADPGDPDGGRLYRTGDLVRWNGQGQLEYLGRIDHQVKIRGLRIELGEVEAQLLAQEALREAVVITQPAADGLRLVAYVSPRAGNMVTPTQIREQLGQRLPAYMVPDAVVVLPTLPLNANGKVDRKALPPAQWSSTRHYVAPEGPIEQALAQIWSEVLGIERIGRDDNFFELGGHSISALRVVGLARACQLPGLPLTLRELLSAPSLRELARRSASTMILLNAKVADVAPLFCLHSGIGTVLGYLSLARGLNGVRPVYGIACRTLIDPAHRDHSLETMARDYVAQMRTLQPHGPYHLLGWSLGATLATLVAAELEAAGQQVAFLGLLDAPLLTQLRGTDSAIAWQDEYADLLRKVSAGVEDLPAVPQGIANPLESEQELLAWTRAQLESGRLRPQGAFLGLGAEDLVRRCLIGRALYLAVDRSSDRLPRLAAPIDCWWACDRAAAERAALVQQLGAAHLRQWHSQANHEEMVNTPSLVQQVRSCLDGLVANSGS